MPTETRVVSPGPGPGSVRTAAGEVLVPPPDWELLPPGDATLTRRVKAGGPTWTVQQKKGRKTFSLGVWAPAARIAEIRAELETQRATPGYAKRKASDAARRERKQGEYVEDFRSAVLEFLNFDSAHSEVAAQLAEAVAAHATPVGSGTVARTQRIPIEKRAEAAVIAWMRHQTTAYDGMKIARVKGERRAVRRQLAAQSKRLLERYRQGRSVSRDCPLLVALENRELQGD